MGALFGWDPDGLSAVAGGLEGTKVGESGSASTSMAPSSGRLGGPPWGHDGAPAAAGRLLGPGTPGPLSEGDEGSVAAALSRLSRLRLRGRTSAPSICGDLEAGRLLAAPPSSLQTVDRSREALRLTEAGGRCVSALGSSALSSMLKVVLSAGTSGAVDAEREPGREDADDLDLEARCRSCNARFDAVVGGGSGSMQKGGQTIQRVL